MANVRWITNDWRIAPPLKAAAPLATDPLVQQLIDLSGRKITAQQFVASPRPARAAHTSPEIVAEVEGKSDSAYLFVSRHPSGAIRFHPPRETLPALSTKSETTLFVLNIDRSRVATRIGGAVQLILLCIAGRLVERSLPELAKRWEEASWNDRGLNRGWVRVDPQRLGIGAPLPSISDDELRAAVHGSRKILLLLHGILSNAEAAFTGLALPSSGASFFTKIGAGVYDHILGFHHLTVSQTPEENARALLEPLPAEYQARFDVITHSRGGIVFRVATELAPTLGVTGRLHVSRAVLVASPNEGSPLAAPTRLVHLLNLIANMAEMFPASPFANGLAFVAEALAWVAENLPRSLPAVSALAPQSTVITALQQASGSGADLTAIVSNYEPTQKAWQRLIDAGIDEVFGSANDLVVPTAGAWRLDGAGAGIPADRIAMFGRAGNIKRSPDEDVIHTNYFGQPETISMLVSSLEGKPLGLRPFDPADDPPWRSIGAKGEAGDERKRDASAHTSLISPSTRGLSTGISDPFHLMLLPDGARRYQLVARFRNALATEDFPTHGGAAGKTMQKIIAYHEQIRSFVRGRPGVEMPTTVELRDYGALLFETLFRGDIQRLYDVARSTDPTRRLDLVFVSTLDWIADKPWEFAWDPSREAYLAVDAVNFTRNVFTAVPSAPIAPSPDGIRILVVSAQPLNAGFLSVAEEEEVILSGFRPLIDAGLARVDVLRSATPDRLHRHLEMDRWDVVHFIGHGEYDETRKSGYLVFEDDRGGTHTVPTETLRSLFCRHGIKLVFLNACESGRGALADYNRGVAPGLMAGGVPAVIANQYVVLDHSATAFARRFYWSLAHGATLGDSAREARVSLNYQIHGEAIDWAVPVLFARDPSDRLCEPREWSLEAPPAETSATRSRRLLPNRLRIALWDVNGVIPTLESLARMMTEAQQRFSFDVVRITAPIGTWRQTVVDEQHRHETYLDAREVARRIGSKPEELGVDYLFCITTLPLSDGDILNLYLWEADEGNLAILSVSLLFPRIVEAGGSRHAAIINALAGALAGRCAGLESHIDGALSCPAHFNSDIDVQYLGGTMTFDDACLRIMQEKIDQRKMDARDRDAIVKLLAL